jgi:hypothetical protein
MTATGSAWRNVVSTESVIVNLVEGRIDMPMEWSDNIVRLTLAGRVQDDQAPGFGGRKGFVE